MNLPKAKKHNARWHTRLQWQVPKDFPEGFAEEAFALRVAQLQRQHGLVVDGILGPKTLAVMRKPQRARATGHLIIAGKKVPVPFPVVAFEHPEGFSFYGHRGWKRRKRPDGSRIDLFVLHWDACVSSQKCFEVLLRRGLSVHLMLDGDGTVYQALDLASATAYHAGGHNERSIGIEIQNPVHPRHNQSQQPPRPVIDARQAHGGRKKRQLDFHDVQKERVLQLTEVLTTVLPIPRRLPRTKRGSVRRRLAEEGFRGVCGHYHLSREKPDPGLTLWPALDPLLPRQ